jgi:hypothetical protein
MKRDTLRRLRTRWQCWRVLRAYSHVFKIRIGKSIGFIPVMVALDAVADDGLTELDDS